MLVRRIDEMKGGWFIGNFEPSVFRTQNFEVCFKQHTKGEAWDVHTHKIATEVNYLARGKMTIQGHTLTAGDIFTIFPGEISDPEFLEDCDVVIVKIPSILNDKYLVTK
jgi:quercetin dioxygenase-like cupin family protein